MTGMTLEQIVALVFCLGGICMILFTYWRIITPKRLLKEGIRTQGKIVEKHTSTHKRRTNHYTISFITQNGQEVNCKKNSAAYLGRGSHPLYDIGDLVTLYYAEKNPKQIYLEQDMTHLINFVPLFLIGWVMLIWGLVAVFMQYWKVCLTENVEGITEYKDLLLNHYEISESELKAMEKEAVKKII